MSQEDETLVMVEKPKRAPRKRVVKSVSETDDSPKPTPRKRVTKKETDDSPKRTTSRRKTVDEDAPARKAPTPIATQKVPTRKSKKQRYVVIALLVLGIASSAAVGFTDKGSINVEATITERNEQSRAAGREGEIVPVNNTDPEPDGGLIGLMEVSSTPVATPTASSTESVATSTEPTRDIPIMVEEVAAQENAPAEPAQ